MLFKTDAEKAFGTETYLSPEMDNAIKLWEQLESGKPPWLKDSDGRTISFSNTVSRELAKLITQNIDVKVQKSANFPDGENAAFIQQALNDYFLEKAQEKMERVIRLGGMMAKWDGEGIEYVPPSRFLVTAYNSKGDITGVIFFFYYSEGREGRKKYYTRAEWHRFEDSTRRNDDGTTEKIRTYRISNKAFVSDTQDQIGRPTELKNTKWAHIMPEFPAADSMKNLELEKPLYTYIKNPYSNTIDPDSPLGVSCFSECIEELRWLDIAMSTMGTETETSAPMMMVDQTVIQYATMNGIKLPKFISNVGMAADDNKPVEQWQPQLQIANRTEGINFYLNVIAMKTGFSEGYFTFNEKSGLATATQVEADERRTINTMMMYRNILDRPNSNGDGRVGVIHDIAYIIDVMSVIIEKDDTKEIVVNADQFGGYELFCNFADPFQNTEEDRQRAYQLMIQRIISKVYYLTKYEGFTEEEARKMVKEAADEDKELNPEENILFQEE